MKNYNSLQQKRNLLIFEKLLKNINVNSNKILLKEVFVNPFEHLRLLAKGRGTLANAVRELGGPNLRNFTDIDPSIAVYDSAKRPITNIQNLRSGQVFDDLGRAIDDAGIDSIRTHNASLYPSRLQNFIDQLVVKMESDRIASQGTIIKFLKDQSVPLDKKNAFLERLAAADPAGAEAIKGTVGIGVDSAPLPKFQWSDLRAINPVRWKNPLNNLYTVFKTYRNWYESVSGAGMELSPSLRVFRNIIKLGLQSGSENADSINKKILQFILGDSEYERIVNKIANENPSKPRLVKDIKYEEILEKVDDQIYRNKIKEIQDSLHDELKSLDIKIGTHMSNWQRFQKSYEQAMMSADPVVRSAALRWYSAGLHWFCSGFIQWLAPYEKTKWGVVPLILRYFKIKKEGLEPIWNWTINVFLVGPLFSYFLNQIQQIRAFSEEITKQHKEFAEQLRIEKQKIESEMDGLDPNTVTQIVENIQQAETEVTETEALIGLTVDLGDAAMYIYMAPGMLPRMIGQKITLPLYKKLYSFIEDRDVMEPETELERAKSSGKKWSKFFELQKMSLDLKIENYLAKKLAKSDPDAVTKIQERIEDLKKYVKELEKKYEGFSKYNIGAAANFPEDEFKAIFRSYLGIIIDIERLKAKAEKAEKTNGTEETPAKTPKDGGPVDGI